MSIKQVVQAVLFIVCFGAVGVVKADSADDCSFDYDFEVQMTADQFQMCLARDFGYEDYNIEECHQEFSVSMQVINETQALINKSTPVSNQDGASRYDDWSHSLKDHTKWFK